MCWERGLCWREQQDAGVGRSACYGRSILGVWGVCGGPGLSLLKVVLGKWLHVLAPWL